MCWSEEREEKAEDVILMLCWSDLGRVYQNRKRKDARRYDRNGSKGMIMPLWETRIYGTGTLVSAGPHRQSDVDGSQEGPVCS